MLDQTKRRFSIEDDFFESRADLHLYGIMRCLSTAKPDPSNPVKWKEYLSKSTLTKNKKIIFDLCSISSQATFRNHLNKLITEGLIIDQGTEYYFPFDYNGRYKLISKQMLEYLMMTKNDLSLKVYLYLFNKNYKENYEFTITELMKAFGYSINYSPVSKAIGLVLAELQELGIISYEEGFRASVSTNGDSVGSPIKILIFVKTTPPDFATPFLR